MGLSRPRPSKNNDKGPGAGGRKRSGPRKCRPQKLQGWGAKGRSLHGAEKPTGSFKKKVGAQKTGGWVKAERAGTKWRKTVSNKASTASGSTLSPQGPVGKNMRRKAQRSGRAERGKSR